VAAVPAVADDARLGRLKEAEPRPSSVLAVRNTMHSWRPDVLTLGADIARVRGDRGRRARADRSAGIEHVRKTGFSNFIAFDEAEATFGAWLAGDDAI